MKKHIQIKNSYTIWSPKEMRKYTSSITFLHIFEWWLHNVEYYITLPYCNNSKLKKLNERFKHVDLMVNEK